MQSAILFSVPWSLGGVTDNDGRHKFDQFYRDLLAGKLEAFPVPKVLGKVEVPFPDNGLVYDYMYEVCVECLFAIQFCTRRNFRMFQAYTKMCLHHIYLHT